MPSQILLTNASDNELASAVHENLYELFRSMKVLSGYELVENDKLSHHHAYPTNPMFKGVWKTRLSPEEVESEIDKAITWFNERDAPYFFWWTDSQTQPTDLADHLLKHGFDGNLEGDPGMALDLRTLKEDVSPLEDFNIIQAVNQRTLEDWRDVFNVSNEQPVSAGQAWVDATLDAGLQNAPWQMYVGYLNNKPVASSILFNGAGVTGIYGVGVLPEARRRGLGAAITLKPLLDVRMQDYHYAVLFSTRMGYSVYQRLGFHEVACKIGIYILERE